VRRHRGEWNRLPPSTPRPAEGGVKARTKRGAFAQSWWSRRWIESLERLGMQARLQRGRRYARDGQVLSIEIGRGEIRAAVQGSRPKPYQVRVEVAPFSQREWRKATEVILREAGFTASLLAGGMDPAVEEALARAGVSLFPHAHKDLTMSCSCPDWEVPCKHLAAVHYLVAEALDADPFLLFELRGIAREAFLASLVGKGGEAPAEEGETGEDLPADVAAFWQGQPLPPRPQVEVAKSPVVAHLGPFPFWQGATDLVAWAREVLAQASGYAIEAWDDPERLRQEEGDDTVEAAPRRSQTGHNGRSAGQAEPSV
jgi:uncharacterized Zn finger protein